MAVKRMRQFDLADLAVLPGFQVVGGVFVRPSLASHDSGQEFIPVGVGRMGSHWGGEWVTISSSAKAFSPQP